MIPLSMLGPAVFAYAGVVLYGSIIVDVLDACARLWVLPELPA